jgi:cytochrome c-type biogenesis protein CcmH
MMSPSSNLLWSAMGFAALIVLIASVVAAAGVRATRQSRAPLTSRIAAAQLQLALLRARLQAGEIQQSVHDQQIQQLTSSLLEMSASQSATTAWPSRMIKICIGGAVVVAIGAGVLWGTAEAPVPFAATEVTPPATDMVDRAASEVASSNGADSPSPRTLSDEQLERMIQQASGQVEKNPKDASAWAMLAHSYDMLGKFAESSKAYAKLVTLVPADAQAYADYADALAVSNGRTLEGEPDALVRKALRIDAKNVKALALAGTAEFERKHFDAAIAFWVRARDASSDATFKSQIESSIAEAKESALHPGADQAAPAIAANGKVQVNPSRPNAEISGRVSLSDELLAKASPDATVYIFARPTKGSRMPVALLRKQVRDLPINFTLDDSMSMVPNLKLSRESSVVVGARVSKRGDVMPQPGDLQGWSAPVSVGTHGIKLEISEVLK